MQPGPQASSSTSWSSGSSTTRSAVTKDGSDLRSDEDAQAELAVPGHQLARAYRLQRAAQGPAVDSLRESAQGAGRPLVAPRDRRRGGIAGVRPPGVAGV